MTGRTGYTEPTVALSPNGPAQMVDIYEHFDPLIGETCADAASLPTAGLFTGRTVYIQDIGVLVAYTGSAWKRYYPVYAEAAGTVTINGTGASTATTAVAFPAGRFSVAPIVTIAGDNTPSGATLAVAAKNVTTSGFDARGAIGGGTFTGTYTVGWRAVQMLSAAAAG